MKPWSILYWLFSFFSTASSIIFAVENHPKWAWFLGAVALVAVISGIFALIKEINKQQIKIKYLETKTKEQEIRFEKAELANTNAGHLAIEQIRALKNDIEMGTVVKQLIQEKAESIRRVTMIHYSGKWGMNVISDLWQNTNADIEVYLVNPDQDDGVVSSFQKDRIRHNLSNIRNDYRKLKPPGRLGYLKVFTYRAPGAVRAMLIHEHVAFVSSYFYQVSQTDDGGNPTIDPRGHEVPTLALPAGTPAFSFFSNTIHETVENWKKHREAILHEDINSESWGH